MPDEIDPTLRNRLNRRMTPRVRHAAAAGLEKIIEGIEGMPLDFPPISSDAPADFYEGLIRYTAALSFGEAGSAIDWSRPPTVGRAEQRYFVVLNNLADAIAAGNAERARLAVLGITAFKGSRADSGGIPCQPEVLAVTGLVITSIESLLANSGLQPADITGRAKISRGIRTLTTEFHRHTEDRANLGIALLGLRESIIQREVGQIPVIERLANFAIPVINRLTGKGQQ